MRISPAPLLRRDARARTSRTCTGAGTRSQALSVRGSGAPLRKALSGGDSVPIRPLHWPFVRGHRARRAMVDERQ